MKANTRYVSKDFIEISTLKSYLPCTCSHPEWYTKHDSYNNRYYLKCANCHRLLTIQQMKQAKEQLARDYACQDLSPNDSEPEAKKSSLIDNLVQDYKYEDFDLRDDLEKGFSAKLEAVLDTYQSKSTTEYNFIKQYLACRCGQPDWQSVYNSRTHMYHIRCSRCHNLATQVQVAQAHETRAKATLEPAPKPDPEVDYKYDQGKIRVSLIKRFGLALLAVAELTTIGAKKYEDHSWTTVKNGVTRYDDALFSHYLQEAFEDNDSETQVRHEVATAWNALVKLQLMIDQDPTWKARLMRRDMENKT